MKYKILTRRFAEFAYGEIADIDAEAARVPLENGEIEAIEVKTEEEKEKEELTCEVCGKICKNIGGYKSHMRSHKK